MPFADATCQALLGLVLRHSAVAPDRPLPGDFIDALRELASRDEALAECFQSNTPTVDWQGIARRLPQLLVQSGHLGRSEAEPNAAVDASGGEPLSAVCHMVLRMQALETSFATELNRQKTEAIYQFAYGLSHELNNPLANIATRAGLLARDEALPKRQQMLETIVTNAMRGCEMLGDLMLVARPPKLCFESTRIDQLIAQLIARARPWAAPWQVVVQERLLSQASLDLDPAAFSEAVWALIRNAIEAMPDGGEITVSVTDQMPDGPPAQHSLRIEVADQGHGLSPKALEHCFDPYYSGREAGRGLGLGLAKARRIIDLHGGVLSVSNRPGGGCLARIELRCEALALAADNGS